MNSQSQRLSSFCPDAQPSAFRRILSWIRDNQRFASALVVFLAALLVFASVAAYCFSTRYKFYPSKFLIFDHWTGKCRIPDL